jgi:hypothetical protein
MSTEDLTPGAPRFYIVEVKDEDKQYHVVCEPTVVIKPGEGWNGISADELADYIEQHKVPAAPLPGRPGHEMRAVSAGAGR